jgi:hypothetical protein
MSFQVRTSFKTKSIQMYVRVSAGVGPEQAWAS